MRLSTKSRFAVTAMIDMGLRQHQGPVSLAAISQRQHISISYLEQIFSKMRQHGLVDSTRGPGGGYNLNRDANLISVADIIYAVNSPDEKEELPADAEQNGYVSAEELWSSLNQKMDDHMQSISLHSLIAAQLSKGGRSTSNGSPKRGVFAQKPQAAAKTKTPNSVFALGNAWVNSH
ncbi:Rrf2 family transcriptional regulator [Limnohabitans sp.]|jgi:Rrf2 family iron-sulfur cluster assembly transcriptional regulator|uniref:Rrf2 family transcriptional regulator n=1 Tax=Limnohabitans sp. TaxID=1907725 RepID=UPI003340533A